MDKAGLVAQRLAIILSTLISPLKITPETRPMPEFHWTGLTSKPLWMLLPKKDTPARSKLHRAEKLAAAVTDFVDFVKNSN